MGDVWEIVSWAGKKRLLGEDLSLGQVRLLSSWKAEFDLWLRKERWENGSKMKRKEVNCPRRVAPAFVSMPCRLDACIQNQILPQTDTSEKFLDLLELPGEKVRCSKGKVSESVIKKVEAVEAGAAPVAQT